MRRRLQAALLVAATALVPIVAWLGNAALALVTLRRGPQDGALILLGAVVVYGGIELVLGGQALAVVSVLLLVWLPMYGTALVLRVSISLPLAVLTVTGFALLTLAAWHIMVPEPRMFWEAMLAPVLEGMPEAERADMVRFFSTTLVAYVAIGLWANTTIGLLLGRYWQAMLYNPGGFREEFHGLRLDRRLAALALVLLLVASFAEQGAILQFGLVIAMPFLLQALAVVHTLAFRRGWSKLWLVLMYVSLPFVYVPVALVGILDSFVDIRRRYAGHGADTD
ncbi:MAG: hypothetical protein JJT90_02410 [Ectothiorhodospiraceae bacterium]|nr:hypothetical protein [Ectothiorhodospiraceae bacterium]